MSDTQDPNAGGCPVAHDSVTAHGSESENPAIDAPTPKTGGRPHGNRDWWPNQLDLSVLHAHSTKGNPLGPDFSYAKENDMGLLKRMSGLISANLNDLIEHCEDPEKMLRQAVRDMETALGQLMDGAARAIAQRTGGSPGRRR